MPRGAKPSIARADHPRGAPPGAGADHPRGALPDACADHPRGAKPVVARALRACGHTRGACALAAALAAACATPEPPIGPPAPEPVRLGEPVPVYVETLTQGPAHFAAALPDGRVLVGGEGSLLALSPGDPESTPLAALDATSATPLPDGAVLVGTTSGLYALQGDAIAASPLAALYPTDGSERTVRADDALYFADGAGLARWRGGALERLDLPDLPVEDALLAFGSRVQDNGALWVASGQATYALVAQGADLVSWQEAEGLAADALAVDGLDDLWARVALPSESWGLPGDLRRRLPDGTWQWFRLPTPPEALAAGPSSALWLAEPDGALVRSALDRWDAVDHALAEGESLAAVDALGRAFVVGPSGVRRVSTDRPAAFLGLAPGEVLAAPTVVLVVPSLGAEVLALDATLDGVLLASGGPRELAIPLDPLLLSDGPHELGVRATYADGEATSSLPFVVGTFVPPTWAEDIAPLNAARCLTCHGPEGGAHLLDTRARWADEVDGILASVSSGVMPLRGGRLDDSEIRLIELWRAGGTPE